MAAALRSGAVSPRRFWMTAGATSATAPLTNRTTPSDFLATVPRAGTAVLPHPIDHRVNSAEETADAHDRPEGDDRRSPRPGARLHRLCTSSGPNSPWLSTPEDPFRRRPDSSRPTTITRGLSAAPGTRRSPGEDMPHRTKRGQFPPVPRGLADVRDGDIGTP